jgi:hypothetical protein
MTHPHMLLEVRKQYKQKHLKSPDLLATPY